MIHYLVCCKYIPSSAVCNRIRLFGKGLEENGCDCKIHFWDFGHSRMQKLFAIFKHSIRLMIFVNKLSKKDILIIYGETPLTFLYNYISRRTNFMIEKTEYPLHLIIKDLPFFSYRRSVRNLYNYHKADGLITCSTALKKFFLQYNSEIFISPLIVDLNDFALPYKQESPISGEYVAYCGSLDNNKDGVPTLIKAFSGFHKVYNHVKLVIIGSGTEKTLRELGNIVDSECINDYVLFTGSIPHDSMANWLCNASMLALARPNNKQAEGGMPSKVGEYFASGVPCVITNVGDLHLYFKDAYDCYIAEPDSVQSFTEKMLQCYRTDNYEIIKNAKETVKQFNCKEQANNLLDYLVQKFPNAELLKNG